MNSIKWKQGRTKQKMSNIDPLFVSCTVYTVNIFNATLHCEMNISYFIRWTLESRNWISAFGFFSLSSWDLPHSTLNNSHSTLHTSHFPLHTPHTTFHTSYSLYNLHSLLQTPQKPKYIFYILSRTLLYSQIVSLKEKFSLVLCLHKFGQNRIGAAGEPTPNSISAASEPILNRIAAASEPIPKRIAAASEPIPNGVGAAGEPILNWAG